MSPSGSFQGGRASVSSVSPLPSAPNGASISPMLHGVGGTTRAHVSPLDDGSRRSIDVSPLGGIRDPFQPPPLSHMDQAGGSRERPGPHGLLVTPAQDSSCAFKAQCVEEARSGGGGVGSAVKAQGLTDCQPPASAWVRLRAQAEFRRKTKSQLSFCFIFLSWFAEQKKGFLTS